MNKHDDYLSEFEQEFELDYSLSANEQSDFMGEFDENEFELENSEDSHASLKNEWELEEEEYEYDDADADAEAWEYPPEQEYENRLYNVLNSRMDNEFEMDQEVDRILNEMEQDFFFKKLKSIGKQFLNSAGGQFVKKIAKNSPLGTAIGALSKVARGDIKGVIKAVVNNGLLKHAAGFLPGGSLISKGMDIVSKLENNQIPGISRDQLGRAVQFAKSAYGHLANEMPQVRSVEHLRSMGKVAIKKAREELSSNPMRGKKKTRIPLEEGSIVTVHPTHINIWKP